MLSLVLAIALQAAPTSTGQLRGFMEALRSADAALVAGNPGLAREQFERALQVSDRNPTIAYGLACAAARAGQEERALDWLDRALEWGWVDQAVARWDPNLDSLRSASRFEALLERMKPIDHERRSRLELDSIWRMIQQEDPRARPSAVTITSDGQYVLAGYHDGRVLVLDAETGLLVRELSRHFSAIWKLAGSPDSKRLAAISKSGRLSLWSIGGGRIRSLDTGMAPNEDPYPFGVTLSWNPQGERVLLVGEHGDASLWSKTGDLVTRWSIPPPSWDLRAVWTPDSERVLTAEGNLVRARDGRTGELLSTPIEADSPISTLAISPDGAWVVTGHAGGWGVLWDLERGTEFRRRQFVDPFTPEPEDEIASIAFSPDGTRLAWTTRQGSHAELTDVATFRLLWQSEDYGAHFGEPMPIAWSPDGARVWYAFVCGMDGLVTAQAHPRNVASCYGSGAVPDFACNRGAFACDGGAAVVDARTARLLWRRIEIPGGYLIQAPSRYFTGQFEALPELTLGRCYDREQRSLEARHVEQLFDPKRVRAAQAGIPIVVPKLFED
jgi:WD40 repeat protein